MVMVTITPKEWEAIQAKAISSTKLSQILDNTDLDQVRKYATPKDNAHTITDAKRARIQQKLALNRYTIAEIAASEGVSVGSGFSASEMLPRPFPVLPQDASNVIVNNSPITVLLFIVFVGPA